MLIDEHRKNRRFLILGSASRDLLRQSSETVAGRIGYIELTPFSLSEVDDSSKLWLRGGFPSSYLAENDENSYNWRQNYISTFLERDIPNLGFNIPAAQMRRFWLMISHYHGQKFNANEIGKSLLISRYNVDKYLDVLAGTFMLRVLLPWYENIQKRQVRSPKVYFRDSGLLHALLAIHDTMQLFNCPRLGSFWEGFALEEVIRVLGITGDECFYWATHADAELDLFLISGGKRIGFEFKYTESPKITKSMRISLVDLKLDYLVLVYPGSVNFALDKNMSAYGLGTFHEVPL